MLRVACSVLDEVLAGLPHQPDVWGEGALFAFSGIDGATKTTSSFVGGLGPVVGSFVFHTGRQRVLEMQLPAPGMPRLVCGDVVGIAVLEHGEAVLAFAAWHTLVGVVPAAIHIQLRFSEGGPAEEAGGGAWVTADPSWGDAVVLCRSGDRVAISFGGSVELARKRAAAGLQEDPVGVARERLAFIRSVPRLGDAGRERLARKCASVMKVNVLGPEGRFVRRWSTPDRVPHRDQWLWDTVFHSWGMNHLDPELSWDLLASVLETQHDDGLITHQVGVAWEGPPITQPPLLAWGVWESYRHLRDRDRLAWALPRLEAYLQWDLDHRDSNGNGLLEWFIEGDPDCRSGESGMDNSPRFDQAVLLDSVDFSTYAAVDMACLAQVAAEVGQEDRARLWQERARRSRRAVHDLLWDEGAGFYFDRGLGDSALSGVAAVTGFLPLLLPDLPRERAGRLVAALEDPGRFAAPAPVPSVSLSDPSWGTDMWRGPMWVNTNLFVALGLARQGFAARAAALAEASIETVDRYYRSHGVIFEFFDSSDRLAPSRCDRKGPPAPAYDLRGKGDAVRDFHWSAALTLSLLLGGVETPALPA